MITKRVRGARVRGVTDRGAGVATAPTRRSDVGFTLLETLVSLVVLATIGAVMVAIVSVVLRNSPQAEARSDDARSILGLVTWIPQDVDSTPPTGFDTDPLAPTGCGVEPDGNERRSLLRLQWSESYGEESSTFVAAYHHVRTGPSARIVRVTCRPSDVSLGVVEQNLTSDVPLLPAGWQSGDAPAAVTVTRDEESGDVVAVRFVLSLVDGGEVVVDAAPKNPGDTLPPTTLPGWRPPAPETSEAVNYPPVVEDQALEVHPGSPRSTTVVASDENGNPIELSILSSPAGWLVELSGDLVTITASEPASFPTTRSIVIGADDQNDGFGSGEIVVTVVDPATPISTTTTSTSSTLPLVQCEVLDSSISPSPVRNVQQDSSNQNSGNVNIGVLRDKVTIVAITNDECTGLEVRYDSGGTNSPPQVGLVQTGPNSWAAELPGRDEGSSETWSDGDHLVGFFDADGGPWGTIVLRIN
ncbi:MAG: PulJ/GspJ family protein [Ilumatobacteraceae bacterium]